MPEDFLLGNRPVQRIFADRATVAFPDLVGAFTNSTIDPLLRHLVERRLRHGLPGTGRPDDLLCPRHACLQCVATLETSFRPGTRTPTTVGQTVKTLITRWAFAVRSST